MHSRQIVGNFLNNYFKFFMAKLYSILLIFLLMNVIICHAQKNLTPFETSQGKASPGYFEIIAWWQKIDKASPKIQMQKMGMTDAGYPLHLITVSNSPLKSFKAAHDQKKIVILINNGIHPGEPDGIDASMLLARDIAENKIQLPDKVVLAIIPIYNIGGCLNRSRYYRVDQNGPEEKGSRGNSQNLDLNRDFIKCDSKESLSFAEIFHQTDPDIFIDNHVSNGADYQHIMTLLTSQYNKLGAEMGAYMHNKLEPGIYALMKKEGYDLIPYLNYFGHAVDEGLTGFWDSPRYASGYATLFHCFSFVPETHMLKPFLQRVKATYTLMKCFIAFADANCETIINLRKEAKSNTKNATQFAVSYKLDSSVVSGIEFKGYKGTYKKSEVSGLPRLYYDRAQPYAKQIPFYNYYVPVKYTTKPKAYIIPQGWWKVIDRLKANNVAMKQLSKDSVIEVESYYIKSYKSSAWPYQMHHMNSSIQTEIIKEMRQYKKGDFLIMLNQEANRFLVETLEPYCEDSYFVWNFFDGILNQKEWFSDYHYEDIAAAYLQGNPSLQQELIKKRNNDSTFSKDAEAQLAFIFSHSPYQDKDYMRYPVGRVM